VQRNHRSQVQSHHQSHVQSHLRAQADTTGSYLSAAFRISGFCHYSQCIEKLQVPCVPNWCFSTPTPCYRIVDSAYNHCTSFVTNNIEMDTDIELNRSEL
jgi:hypothetical protein